MLPERTEDLSVLKTLAEIQRLALHGDDLHAILQATVAFLAAKLGTGDVAVVSAGAEGHALVLACGGEAPGNPSKGTAFEIAADDTGYATLLIGRTDLSAGEGACASLAAGLLATAFIRLEGDPQPAARAGGAVDLASGRLPPSIELVRRVRNILSVIRVIIRRTAERAGTVEDYAAQLDGRISALARVQTPLITSQEHSTDLGTLIDDEMLAHSIKEGRIRTQGPRIPLQAKAAETLSLTVHELTENAIKFGALSAKNGRIDVSWWIDEGSDPRQLRLEWIETGVPVLSTAPRIRGFGHELIERTLPYELSAETHVDFRPGGFRCALAIPLSDRVISSDPAAVR
jgi:two-component sensor histidine kinase